ncbi:hypothetical protein GJU80_12650 [Neisseria brasiliensis]|uniref:Attachment protein n=1 Tax=Neisseria brasiliensis TaxID=2666100 RepID=A0A7X2KZK3_9NEIS|nr:virulence factor TspB C-terminal domain-related protein [Neisseria brasiliensis]MRN39303.1 hypothetical protein [Neisseria brasiliensis]
MIKDRLLAAFLIAAFLLPNAHADSRRYFGSSGSGIVTLTDSKYSAKPLWQPFDLIDKKSGRIYEMTKLACVMNSCWYYQNETDDYYEPQALNELMNGGGGGRIDIVDLDNLDGGGGGDKTPSPTPAPSPAPAPSPKPAGGGSAGSTGGGGSAGSTGGGGSAGSTGGGGSGDKIEVIWYVDDVYSETRQGACSAWAAKKGGVGHLKSYPDVSESYRCTVYSSSGSFIVDSHVNPIKSTFSSDGKCNDGYKSYKSSGRGTFSVLCTVKHDPTPSSPVVGSTEISAGGSNGVSTGSNIQGGSVGSRGGVNTASKPQQIAPNQGGQAADSGGGGNAGGDSTGSNAPAPANGGGTGNTQGGGTGNAQGSGGNGGDGQGGGGDLGDIGDFSESDFGSLGSSFDGSFSKSGEFSESGYCPQPVIVDVSFAEFSGSFELSYDLFCEFAKSIRIFVVMSGWAFSSLMVYYALSRVAT